MTDFTCRNEIFGDVCGAELAITANAHAVAVVSINPQTGKIWGEWDVTIPEFDLMDDYKVECPECGAEDDETGFCVHTSFIGLDLVFHLEPSEEKR